MGITVDFMRRHVNQLKPGEMFSTRVMLGYGERGTVDQNLRRFVAKGMISRVARGLYMKLSANPLERVPFPSLTEIVRAKAKAFGKVIMSAGRETAQALGIDQREQRSVEFAVSGWSSSFDTVRGRVLLKQKAPRILALGDTLVGKTLRGLWHIGKEAIESTQAPIIISSTIHFNRMDREEMRTRTAQLPSWLTSALHLPLKDLPRENKDGKPEKRLRREPEFDPRLIKEGTANSLLAMHRVQANNPVEYAEMLNLLQQLIRK